ncbi:MAG: hypothetical protein K9N52_06380 [Verrucomicrobia bacterium]|nr:hypothetical protein [Verrucomicrobiota bacterium]
MKKIVLTLTCIIPVALFVAGCGEKEIPEKVEVNQLEEAFAGAETNEPPPDVNPEVYIPPKQIAEEVVNRVRQNNYEGAAVRLNELQRQRGLSKRQRMAVHQTMRQVQQRMAARIAAGDKSAREEAEFLQRRLAR